MDIAILYLARKERRKCFLTKLVEAEGQSSRRFEDALQTVSIAAGIKPPPLRVFDLPTPNAFAYFESAGRPSVGVTLKRSTSI